MIIMTQQENKMVRDTMAMITERKEEKEERNVRFLPILYWTD